MRAQPRPPDRDPRSGRGRPQPARADAHVRLDHGGHPLVVGAARGRQLGARARRRKGSAGQSLHGALMRRARARARRASAVSRARADSSGRRAGNNGARASRDHRRGSEHAPPTGRRPVRPAGRCPCTRSGSSSGSARRSSATATSARRSVAQAVEVARAQTRKARRLGCERVEILVTSPGRQSAQQRGVRRRAGARHRRARTRILSSEEEGALAWDGARGCARAAAGEHRRLRHRRRLGTARRRHARGRAWLGALGRPRLAAPDRHGCSPTRPAVRGGCRAAGRRPRRRLRRSCLRWPSSAWRRAAPRARCGAYRSACSMRRRSRGGRRALAR